MTEDGGSARLPRYWEIIRFNAADFLTLHPAYESRLYQGRIEPNAWRDLARGLRGILGGTIRMLQGFACSSVKWRSAALSSGGGYLLLVTIGGAKYAGEEREVVEACRRRGLAVRTVHVSQDSVGVAGENVLSIGSTLTRRDYAQALVNWLGAVFVGLRWCLSSDSMKRSLFVASIPALRAYKTFQLFARRIVSTYGTPTLVLSLAPWTAVSVALVDHMKGCGVLTAGVRTQTTYAEAEHVAINTDILFCKSLSERRAYASVLGESGPKLLDGCLLSIPETYPLKPLDLPREYVLVLGANPPDGQDGADRDRFDERLRQVASAAGLAVVFKDHHLTEGSGEESSGLSCTAETGWVRVTDIRRNRELIDHASLIVSAPSTLLYYAILRETPVIIVELYSFTLLPDEFETAPVRRVAWEEGFDGGPLDWKALHDSTAAAKSWFEENYSLEKGPDFLIGFILGDPRG